MSFLRDSTGSLFLQGAAAAVQLGTGVLLARGLQPEGRGTYALVVLVPSTAVVLTNLGFGAAATRQVAQLPHAAGRIVANAFVLALGVGLLTTLLLYGGGDAYARFAGLGGRNEAILFATLAMPLLLYDRYSSAILTGHKEILASYAIKLVQAVAFASFLFAGFLHERTVPMAVLCWLGSIALADLCAWFAMHRRVHGERRLDTDLLRDALRFGSRLLPGAIALYLLQRSDLFLLRLMKLPTEDIGIYAVAGMLALLFQMLGTSIERAFLPRVLRSRGEDASRLTALVSRCFVLTMVPTMIALIVLARPGIPFVFGGKYSGAWTPFALLLPGIVVGTVGLFCNGDLQSRGMPGRGSLAASLALATNLAANLLLIPRLGTTGAALSSLLSYSLCGLFLAFVYRHVTGTPISDYFVPRRGDVAEIREMLMASVRKRL